MDDTDALIFIGSNWAFDVVRNVGYRVEKGRKRSNREWRYLPAFHLIYTDDGKLVPIYAMLTPIGVIRKAMRLCELNSRGLLGAPNIAWKS